MNNIDMLCKELDYCNGDLMTVTEKPTYHHNQSDWLEKGEWLAAAKKAGTDKLYFINNNPVAVFAHCEDGLQNKIKAFNRIWCLARPRVLFLSTPGELTVYDLACEPVDENNEKEFGKLRPIKTVKVIKNVSEVIEQLNDFHRDNLDSGSLFSDDLFGGLKNRADKALIRDLKSVRKELLEAGLDGDKSKYAHALIGRSIFIRYLEDRGVLDEKYFRNVAGRKKGWTSYLNQPQNRVGLDFSEKEVFYPRVLENKELTYELYRQLARDFNGDMFSESTLEDEDAAITSDHLRLIQDLLYSDVGKQKKLFFFSYRFDIVPLDLISSIYEEFYHSSSNSQDKKSKARQDGAYYTPSSLAEFVVSKVLTKETLKSNPRVLDPACGSGIFLVEAFRRIVRYNWFKKKRPLTFDEMRDVLRDQIAGIEVNPEAARIAAFSLYLAMLHYLDPPAITEIKNRKEKLPNLLASNKRGSNYFHCILPKSAFDEKCLEDNPLWGNRFGNECANVVVGNPPWGNPGRNADEETRQRHQELLDWLFDRNKTISDKEPSQAFLWRATDYLRQGGLSAMLVSAGVFFKKSLKSQSFRSEWFNVISLMEIYNFIHVREVFFKGAISPFVLCCFNKNKDLNLVPVQWSAKHVSKIKGIQAVLFDKQDKIFLNKGKLEDTETWKSSWFGSYKDYVFLNSLFNYPKFKDLINTDSDYSGRGYQTYTSKHDWKEVGSEKTIDKLMHRYNNTEYSSNPSGVYNIGPRNAYSGNRLLVNEGILEDCCPKGQIVSRYEDESNEYSFYRSVYGIKLLKDEPEYYKLLNGILWSSFARYYFFNTTANWGLWNHKILLSELYQLPLVANVSEHPVSRRIVRIVDKLRNYQPEIQTLINPEGTPSEKIEAQRRKWEKQLDEAVFDLYELSEEERDLIRDCCDVTLPFFYKPYDSVGVEKAIRNNEISWIRQYASIFANRWKPYLDENEVMRADVHVGAHENMVAIEFYPADENEDWELSLKRDWGDYLEKIGDDLPQRMGASQIVLDGVAHIVTDDSIIIIKRNIKRLWTRSLAREDADSSIAKCMMVNK